MRIKISVPTIILNTDIRKAIHAAMQVGAQGVQFDLRTEVVAANYGDSARKQLLHHLVERNLELASGHFPLRGPLTEKDRLDQRLSALSSAITLASQLKIRRLTVRPGSIPPVGNEERETLVQIVGELVAQADKLGVVLCLLPNGDSAEELVQFVSEVSTGLVMIDADPADWVLNGLSYVSELRGIFGHIGHFEGRDAARGATGGGREVPVGRGEIRWEEVAALLTEMGYTGWINVQRTIGSDRVSDVASGVDVFRKLFIDRVMP